jgi:hypothetical protein
VPFILRKVRKARWYKDAAFTWLPQGELQADALADLNTSSNTLSVWTIQDYKANLEDVVTALASAGDFISNFDYALLDVEELAKLRIDQNSVNGQTPCEGTNHWHVDLIQLTAGALILLASAFSAGGQIERVPEKRVRNLLEQAKRAGKINLAKLTKSLSEKLA